MSSSEESALDGDKRLYVASFNIGCNDQELFTFVETSPQLDVICVQECDWESRNERHKGMLQKFFRLAGSTKGASREDRKNATEKRPKIVCLETYIKHPNGRLGLQPKSEAWRCSSHAHEITYDENRCERRREMALSCNLVFQTTNIWIINIHLATRPDASGFSKSSDWHWRYSLPELGMWYNDKEVIIAGDWNFDAPSAFAGFDVVGRGTKFFCESQHRLPIFGIGLQFFDCQTPTFRLAKKGVTDVRVDAIGYRRPPYPQVAEGLRLVQYDVPGKLTANSQHLPVVAVFQHPQANGQS